MAPNSHLHTNAETTIDATLDESDAFQHLTVLGVCGSIGSGKSFASRLLTSKLNQDNMDTPSPNPTSTNNHNESSKNGLPSLPQAHHIDTDSLAHGVYAPGNPALQEIKEEFGSCVVSDDGTIDRKALGGIVFSDPSQMKKLEQLVWPHVKTLLMDRLHEIEQEGTSTSYNTSPTSNDTRATKKPIVIVEAAVLLDANWDNHNLFDAIWIIRASPDVATRRLVEGRGMNESDAKQRLEAQVSRRGIGNWEEELKDGVVSAVIDNDGMEEDELWEKMRVCLLDEASWKDERYPDDLKLAI